MPSPRKSKKPNPPPSSSAWTHLVQVTKHASQRLEDGAKPRLPPPPTRIPDKNNKEDTTNNTPTLMKRRHTGGPGQISALERDRAFEAAKRAGLRTWKQKRLTKISPLAEIWTTPPNRRQDRRGVEHVDHRERSTSPESALPNLMDADMLSDARTKAYFSRNIAEWERFEEVAEAYYLRNPRLRPREYGPRGEDMDEDRSATLRTHDENVSILAAEGKTNHLVNPSSRELPEQHVLNGAKTRLPQQDMADTHSSTTDMTNTRSPSDATQVFDKHAKRLTSGRRRRISESAATPARPEHEYERGQKPNPEITAETKESLDKGTETEAAETRTTTSQTSKSPSSSRGGGLCEGTPNALNRARSSTSPSPSSPHQPDATQLAAPESSPSPDAAADDENEDEHVLQRPTRRLKRRLTLHDNHRPATKRRKSTPPVKKRKASVQTTLALAVGESAGMRECQVCDTVYNPFHAEDVRVHKTRHAAALKRDRAMAMEE